MINHTFTRLLVPELIDKLVRPCDCEQTVECVDVPLLEQDLVHVMLLQRDVVRYW